MLITRLLLLAPRHVAPLLLLSVLAAAPAPAPAEPLRLTMQEAVDRALESSFDLIAAQARIVANQSYLDRSGALLAENPFLSVGASDTDASSSSTIAGNDRTKQFGPSYNVSLSQNFEIAGQRSARIASAQHSVDSALSDRRTIEVKLIARVKSAFADTLEARDRVALAQNTTDLVATIHTGFEEQENESEFERLGLNASAIRLARQKRSVDEARENRRLVYGHLARLIGLPAAQEIAPLGELEAAARPLPPLGEMIAAALEGRPEIAAFTSLLARSDADLDLEHRQAIPDVNVFAFVSTGDGDVAGGGSLGMSLPVFQRAAPNVRSAVAERERAAAELDDLKRTVETNVREAYWACEAAAANLQLSLDVIVPLTRENVRLQRRRAQRGEVSEYTVIDEELELLGVQLEYLSARRIYTTALITLERETGVALVDGSAPLPPAAGSDNEKPKTDD